jgi:hypothetical protein
MDQLVSQLKELGDRFLPLRPALAELERDLEGLDDAPESAALCSGARRRIEELVDRRSASN